MALLGKMPNKRNVNATAILSLLFLLFHLYFFALFPWKIHAELLFISSGYCSEIVIFLDFSLSLCIVLKHTKKKENTYSEKIHFYEKCNKKTQTSHQRVALKLLCECIEGRMKITKKNSKTKMRKRNFFYDMFDFCQF